MKMLLNSELEVEDVTDLVKPSMPAYDQYIHYTEPVYYRTKYNQRLIIFIDRKEIHFFDIDHNQYIHKASLFSLLHENWVLIWKLKAFFTEFS